MISTDTAIVGGRSGLCGVKVSPFHSMCGRGGGGACWFNFVSGGTGKDEITGWRKRKMPPPRTCTRQRLGWLRLLVMLMLFVGRLTESGP